MVGVNTIQPSRGVGIVKIEEHDDRIGIAKRTISRVLMPIDHGTQLRGLHVDLAKVDRGLAR